jgi:hypothetical protein
MDTLNRSFIRPHVRVLLFFLFILTVIWTPAASADSVSWADIAPNWTALPNPFTTSSAGGIIVTGSMPSGENALATIGCFLDGSITPCSDTAFLPGEPLLCTNVTTGPLTFLFSSPLQSISTQIQTVWYGSFSATLTAYGSGGEVLATTTVNGETVRTHDGSATLLSFTSGAGIYSVSITATSKYPLSSYDGFSINQLNITLLAITVPLDIKPGSFPNSINIESKGKIPVAILSTNDFNAPNMVNMDSLTFGVTGVEESLAFCNKPTDINKDGLKDLVCHFYSHYAEFQCGDTKGVLKGETVDGTPLEGKDSVKIVPCK